MCVRRRKENLWTSAVIPRGGRGRTEESGCKPALLVAPTVYTQLYSAGTGKWEQRRNVHPDSSQMVLNWVIFRIPQMLPLCETIKPSDNTVGKESASCSLVHVKTYKHLTNAEWINKVNSLPGSCTAWSGILDVSLLLQPCLILCVEDRLTVPRSKASSYLNSLWRTWFSLELSCDCLQISVRHTAGTLSV